MTGKGPGRSALLAPAAVVAMLLALWAASTGPGRVFVLSPDPRGRPSLGVATPSEDAESPGLAEELFRDVEPTADLSWVGDLAAWTVVLGLVLATALGAVWLARRVRRDGWLRPPRPTTVAFDVLPEERAARALADDAAARLEAVEQGSVRNGVVRCWARLEDAVAAAGLPRRPAETSAEFTVRVLHALDLDPHAVGELAGLYREARFSEHALGEDVRERARAALQVLQQDLERVRSAR